MLSDLRGRVEPRPGFWGQAPPVAPPGHPYQTLVYQGVSRKSPRDHPWRPPGPNGLGRFSTSLPHRGPSRMRQRPPMAEHFARGYELQGQGSYWSEAGSSVVDSSSEDWTKVDQR